MAIGITNIDAMGELLAIYRFVIRKIQLAWIIVLGDRYFAAEQRLVLQREKPLCGRGRVFGGKGFGIRRADRPGFSASRYWLAAVVGFVTAAAKLLLEAFAAQGQ